MINLKMFHAYLMQHFLKWGFDPIPNLVTYWYS